MQERARARAPAPRAPGARRRGRRRQPSSGAAPRRWRASRRGSASTRPRSPAVPAIGGCHAASVTETACARRASEKSETPAAATETSCESSPWSGSAPASRAVRLLGCVCRVARRARRRARHVGWPSRRRASRVASALESRTSAPACDEPAGADLQALGVALRPGQRDDDVEVAGRPRLPSRAPTGSRRRAPGAGSACAP